MLEANPLGAWLLTSVAARLLGAVASTVWVFGCMRLAGDANTARGALIQLGGLVALGFAQGAAHGLLTGPALRAFLPDANLEVYVRNNALVAGLELLVALTPVALMWLEPGASYASAVGTDHTLGIGLFILLIGPAQWWAFRGAQKSWWYIAASVPAHLLGFTVEQLALQSLFFAVGFDSLFGTLGRLVLASIIGVLVALPTGIALGRIARVNRAA